MTDDPKKPHKSKLYEKNDDLPLKPKHKARSHKSLPGTTGTTPKTAYQPPTLGAGSSTRITTDEHSPEQQKRQTRTPTPPDFELGEGGLKDIHKPSADAPPQPPQPVDLGNFVDRINEHERKKQESLNPPLKEPDHVFKDGDPLAQSKKDELRRTAPEVEKEFRRTDPQDALTQFNTIKGKDVREEHNKVEGHDLRWQFSKGGRGIDR